MGKNYDFSGWATRNNVKCSDGRTILKDAFKDDDGAVLPLVWNHKHDVPDNVLGYALLENRDEGVYAFCKFNDTESGRNAKLLVEHGDISALSIYANQLKQQGSNVLHGTIREVSLVLAGANPGALIDSVMIHSADGEEIESEDEAIIYTGEKLSLYHSDDKDDEDDETLEEIFATLTEKQKNAVYAIVGAAIEDGDEDDDIADEKEKEKEENKEEHIMKHNVFENEDPKDNVLSHSDQMDIIALAKLRNVGTLQNALEAYAEENGTLAHGFDSIESMFPEYKDIQPGAPELITRDQGWVSSFMQKVHKSPISRIRTRQTDVRGKNLRGSGYKKGKKKNEQGNAVLLNRTTDPQTVYVKDKLNRDDILDITDFDVANYLFGIMRQNLNEELAMAAMVGDGRDVGADDKIYEEHIRPIWKDDELYTIHVDVDVEAARKEIQGTNTGANFGENYVYAEAIIMAALYAREDYKGTGTPDFYCAPHLLNVMLLARDLNGRRIYDSKTDLARALNVGEIHTAEQFEGLVRTSKDNKQKKLLGIFVNLSDYYVGSTKGGEITSFNQFDIDFNQEKYLIETRLSGALVRAYSAIALEEDVTPSGSTSSGGTSDTTDAQG